MSGSKPKDGFLLLSCPEQNNNGLRKQLWGFGKKTSRHTDISDEGRRI